jgi:uncharacterized protein (TIGR04552 family)
MKQRPSNQELLHEIFGSVLDRSEMTPYLLLKSSNYESALKQATKMMGNRGFDTYGSHELEGGEKERATKYIEQAYRYCFDFLFPFVKGQLERLTELDSLNHEVYRQCVKDISNIESILDRHDFKEMTFEDPRHLFLMASSRKYPHVFYGYRGMNLKVPADWQQMACSMLKVAHLIKSIEEDSQDVNDCAQLGFFLQMHGQSLHDLYNYEWHKPRHLPDSEAAQRAFVKISAFFLKLKESIDFDAARGCLVFNSGDGVEVDIVRIESRLKSPESMFTKLGKNLEGEAYDIRDILAITFILKSRDDTLKLFHALQKRGVILQENTISRSITQTLFDSPESMMEAVRSLMISLYKSEGRHIVPEEKEMFAQAKRFYKSLSVNAAENPHSSIGHKKFQCKINFFVPIHRSAGTNGIIIPGTPMYARRHRIDKRTEQHTLALELRISDEQGWSASEQGGDSHHEAYKFRQLVSVMNRVFKNKFHLSGERLMQLRKDQVHLFSEP